MGRPKLELDEEQIAGLALDGASNRQIADLIGCDEGTIRGRFSALVSKKRAERRLNLRKLQWECAETKNPTMLIWLGKQELEQMDKQDITTQGQAITFNIVQAKEPK